MTRSETEMQPFDSNDPFNRVADQLRKDIAGLLVQVMASADFQKLAPKEQLESTAAGMVTGILGALFASIEDGGRDELMQWLIDYLPQARLQVEGIFANARHSSN